MARVHKYFLMALPLYAVLHPMKFLSSVRRVLLGGCIVDLPDEQTFRQVVVFL